MMIGTKVAHAHYHLSRLSEVRRIYWAHSLRLAASNFVAIFIPIYLTQLGYSIRHVLFYLMLSGLLWALIQYPILRLANQIGANRAMALSFAFEAVGMAELVTLETAHWPLWLLALTWAIYVSFYWPSFRSAFAKGLLKQKRPEQSVGISSALITLVYGVAPAFGGLVATAFGPRSIYAVAGIFFALGALPLITGPEILKHEPFDLRTLNLRRVWRDLVANAAETLDDTVLTTIWPLFIFLLIPSYAGVGLLSALAVISGILIALYVGRREAEHGTGKYLRRGVGVTAASNAARLAAGSAGTIAGINLLSGVGHALLSTPFNTRYYANADREPRLPYIYAMMIAAALGWSLVFAITIPLTYIFPTKTVLLIGIALAVPASFGIRLIRAP